MDTMRERVAGLRSAFDLMTEASYQGHLSHWDSTGGHGSGCPACQRASALRAEAVQMWDAAMAIVAEDREKLVAAIFDALTCVDCHNCAKHYDQMRAARDAALASVGK